MRKTPGRLLAFTAVPIWLALSIPLMFCAIYLAAALPSFIVNWAFFSPQYLFSFSQVVRPASNSFVPLFSPTGAYVFGVSLWLLITIGYGVLVRHLPRILTLPLALVTVIVVAIMAHYSFSVLGYSLQLDGP
jgi:hypothetical protein